LIDWIARYIDCSKIQQVAAFSATTQAQRQQFFIGQFVQRRVKANLRSW
jgi:hypothetical protein